MSTLRIALAVSLVVHAVMAVLLASTGAPAPAAKPEAPTRVTLLVSPATAGDTSRAEPSRPERSAPAAGAEPAADPAAPPAFPRARLATTPQPERRIVAALDAPRVAPPAATAAAPALETGQRPIATTPLPVATPRPASRTPLAAPDVLPAPSALLGDLSPDAAITTPRAAATAATPPGTVVAASPAAPGGATAGSVEAASSFGSRTPRGEQPLPAFPDVLRREGREAEVEAKLTIDATGAVTGVEIVKPSGDTSVDNAVERIVRSYLFEPSNDGSIEGDAGVVTFHFRLKKGF